MAGPVLILQHSSDDGPAYLASWLVRQGVPFEVRNTEAGQDFPRRIGDFAALAVLGGEMSANDPLPSLRRAEALILHAMARGRPVIGHCLGGQLMARALGAAVRRSPAPEIGWQSLSVADNSRAAEWFGRAGTWRVFHWHEDAFDLPPGAVELARSAACPHQAFAIGPHLAMQFHVEVDAEKLWRWTEVDSSRHLDALRRHAATVHSGRAMREAMARCLPVQQALADRIYARWLSAAPRSA